MSRPARPGRRCRCRGFMSTCCGACSIWPAARIPPIWAPARLPAFPPAAMLDGFGRLQQAAGRSAADPRRPARARPCPRRDHPPGLYGSEGAQIALNLREGRHRAGAARRRCAWRVRIYRGARATELGALLLTAAILLLLADALISLWLRGLLRLPRRFAGGAAIVAVRPRCWSHPHGARADESFDMKAALDTRLAYVITGVPDVDAMSKAGLTGLGLWLKARTSYEPEAPMGVDLAKDDLAFFPLLYWPMDPREKDLSPEALSKVADYMRNGGTHPDRHARSDAGRDARAGQSRRADLEAPARQARPAAAGAGAVRSRADQGVLSSCTDFPAAGTAARCGCRRCRRANPKTTPAPARGGDGVSPVIIGGNDWAAAWAVDANGEPIVACVPGGERQRENGDPLRHQCRDVCADRQLQDRPGACARPAAAAGQMTAYAIDFAPHVPRSCCGC